MTQEEELQIFKLISAAGTAKSAYMEAIKQAKQGDFAQAQALFAEGDTHFGESHDVHLAMIAAASQGVGSAATLIHVHAEDQLMATEVTKTLAREIVELYQTVDALKQDVQQLQAQLSA